MNILEIANNPELLEIARLAIENELAVEHGREHFCSLSFYPSHSSPAYHPFYT